MRRKRTCQGRRAEGGRRIAIRRPLSTIHYPLSTIATAFTLVELLVVITIIGILVGLLIPAVMAARDRASIAQCTNNQHELGLAILQYEMEKRHLPGYANNVGPTPTVVSWAPVLLPFMGRVDLWEGSSGGNGWRNGNGAQTMVPQFVCPVDRNRDGTSLSYVVNVGQGLTAPPLTTAFSDTNGATQLGVFRNLALTSGTVATQISLSNIRTPSRRPMLTESPYWVDSTGTFAGVALGQNGRQWYTTGAANVVASQFGFIWPGAGFVRDLRDLGIPPPITPLQTNHRGIVIVTFCDGHVESLADETLCSDYDNTPIQ